MKLTTVQRDGPRRSRTCRGEVVRAAAKSYVPLSCRWVRLTDNECGDIYATKELGWDR
jgi:hypothetical protein